MPVTRPSRIAADLLGDKEDPGALLARDIGVRGTIDIDLYRDVAREISEAYLREAAAW